MKNTYLLSLVALALVLSPLSTAFAQNDNNNGQGNKDKQEHRGFFGLRGFFRGERWDHNKMPIKSNLLYGSITAVSGTNLSVTEKKTNTIYTVTTTGATIDKNGATGSLSSLVISDLVFVEGTKNGTTIAATAIHARTLTPDKKVLAGTITAISGSTLTVSAKGPSNTTVAYTVAAGSATIEKNGAAATFSNLAVNDPVRIEGTINGTVITATKIKAGTIQKPVIPQGNGQPIIGGTVTAVSGSTITFTNKSNVSYTINASAATFTKAGKAATIADIAVGDSIVAQGIINGTTIAATSISDQGKIEINQNGRANGLFGKIGAFFSHIFGF